MSDWSVPKGWNLVKLSDLGEVSRGKSKHRPRNASHLYGGKYPFIQTGDIKASKGRITHYTQTYSEAGLAQSRLWEKGTMCITIAANIAETGILQFPACFPDSVIGFIPNKDKCNVYFIEYTFRLLKRKIQSQAIGTVQDNINLQTLERIKFPIPCISEQNRIASILDSFDKKIQLNNETNATLEQIAQAIFKSWFIDFDPVHAKAQTHQQALAEGKTASQAQHFANVQAMQVISGKTADELAHMEQTQPSDYAQLLATAKAFPSAFDDEGLPLGWEEKSLDKIAHYQNGLALQKYRPEPDDEEFLPVVKIKQLKQGYADGEEKASIYIKPECIIGNGDVVFSWSGSLVVDFWCAGKSALNQHLFKVTSENYPKWFYYLYTCYHLAEFIRIANDKAVTMGHIKREHLAQAKCAVPNNELLERLEYLGDVLQKVVENRIENIHLANMRDTLLPKLLNGEINV